MKPEDSLLEFPCDFPIKVMGLNTPAFVEIVHAIFVRHVPDLQQARITRRASANEKYLSLTYTFQAHSREQLDQIYRELSASEQVLMSL